MNTLEQEDLKHKFLEEFMDRVSKDVDTRSYFRDSKTCFSILLDSFEFEKVTQSNNQYIGLFTEFYEIEIPGSIAEINTGFATEVFKGYQMTPKKVDPFVLDMIYRNIDQYAMNRELWMDRLFNLKENLRQQEVTSQEESKVIELENQVIDSIQAFDVREHEFESVPREVFRKTDGLYDVMYTTTGLDDTEYDVNIEDDELQTTINLSERRIEFTTTGLLGNEILIGVDELKDGTDLEKLQWLKDYVDGNDYQTIYSRALELFEEKLEKYMEHTMGVRL